MDMPTESEALEDGAAVGEMRAIRRPAKLGSLCMDPESHRSFSCPEYDTCLDEVVELEWPSWSCASCPRIHRGRENEARRRDHEACSRPDAQ